MPSAKKIVKSALNRFGIGVGQSFSPGFTLFGFNFFADPHAGSKQLHSRIALTHAQGRRPQRVLDVGSGGGHHAQAFRAAGSGVLCVDFGTSVYAMGQTRDGLEVYHGDFMNFEPGERFDLVWASHVLEHQRNVGGFIEKLIDCCSAEGSIYITVPDAHRRLWGGHVSVWSPGLLAYNAVLCGVDLSGSACIRGTDEFTLVFSPKRMPLPDLTFDSGDIQKLIQLLPVELHENGDSWVYWNHLRPLLLRG